ncbi:MAG: rhomboid family intramembrane serine protease [Bacteroidota bacterium]
MRYSQGYGSMGGGMRGSSLLDEFKNAFNRPDNGLIQIILINVVFFVVIRLLHLFTTGNRDVFYLITSYIYLPASINEALTRPWTIFTYFFAHFGVLHILFNMLFLFWFGKIIKEFLGGGKVISLYVLGGLAGGLLFLLIYNLVPYFSDRLDHPMLGASAGVFAVVVGAATFMPNYTIFLLFLGPVRIKYIALFYVFLSVVQSTGPNAGGNIAHLGGAILGFVFIKQLQHGKDWGKGIHWLLSFFKSFFRSQPKVKVSYRKESKKKTTSRTSTGTTKKETASQEEIDAILDKISHSGYESLTKDEKQKLFNASKR